MSPRSTAALLLACALAAACGGRAAPAPEGGAARSPERPAPREQREPGARARTEPRGEERPVDPATAGEIRVRCVLEGAPPPRREIDLSGQAGCADHAGPVLTERVVAADGRLQNVFVQVRSGLAGWVVPPPPEEPVTLAQHGCVYRPHVVALQAGQRLLVTNGDALTHNVNVRAKKNSSSNRSQAQGSPPLELALGRAEDSIPVGCDIHPWMKAWVHVAEHPWFGVSDGAGEVVLRGVPPGALVLEAVHEELGKQRVEVELPPAGSVSVSIVFRP